MGADIHKRLTDFTVELLNAERDVVFKQQVQEPPNPSTEFSPSSIRDMTFRSVFADYSQSGLDPRGVLAGKSGAKDGWAIGGSTHEPHQLVLIPNKQLVVNEPGTLRISIEQNSPHANHLLGRFRLSTTSDNIAIQRSRIAAELLAVIDADASQRKPEDVVKLADYYRRDVAPELKPQRTQLATAEKQLSAMKPATSVPVLRQITDKQRETHLQYRGNYLDKGPLVEPGLPAVFHAPEAGKPLDRRTVAEWLVDPQNPLTARVLANRYWETLFGRGIVLTSEEFGSQGELPTHPKLLDWLATELIQNGWNTKDLVRTIVTSAVYRQSARVDAKQIAADPDNRWLARGPRVRLSAEMVRDQVLFAAGLLSDKLYGPPVKPPQPNLGLKAAFGSATDWVNSKGEDRYRRGLYTTWRRSNPYPSMATFDAPNREVCTVRRNSTNTPLQSLVTLNDPVYVEAAQALARLALQREGTLQKQLTLAFRRCLLRFPTEAETEAMTLLFNDSKSEFSEKPDEAKMLATDPLGELPEGLQLVDAAAMTVVCNVLLNLDEMFLKR